MRKRADEYQVGGNHYSRRAVQPIHLAMSYDLGACELAIVKYLTRWLDKGGVEDLRKALQYCEFAIEHADRARMARHGVADRLLPTVHAGHYCVQNALGDLETVAICSVCGWSRTLDVEQLRTARMAVLDLIHNATAAERRGVPA